MTTLVSSTAYAVSKFMASSGHTIKRSHISEVLSAMLGYETYAALVVEESDDQLDYHLGDAEMLVLNQAAAEQRANSLGITAVPLLLQTCISAMQGSTTTPVYKDLGHFYDSYGREALIDTISSSDDVSAAMSETNAYFDSDPELPEETPATTDLWTERDSWSIEARGEMQGSHDVESDRMFAGNMLNCFAKLTFNKAGRAGLILDNSEAYGGVDDSWRADDRDDEADYMESLAFE
ncbi:hypothetical protein [Duganella phyllosphaerae]|uniref:Uncharacterized protein n=1 Tax=Duganella phyllosphaerae TaxID=762836 RepID=A0A1E7WH51_9BURK|nr:hypothetical protein [Duganella phyllosphaerae]OEZ97976.1 hypothetical protein DUPY_32470 [Duganella phyllosphaerae]